MNTGKLHLKPPILNAKVLSKCTAVLAKSDEAKKLKCGNMLVGRWVSSKACLLVKRAPDVRCFNPNGPPCLTHYLKLS